MNTHYVPLLGEVYIQKDIYGGTARIGEEKHPNKPVTTKANTMYTKPHVD